MCNRRFCDGFCVLAFLFAFSVGVGAFVIDIFLFSENLFCSCFVIFNAFDSINCITATITELIGHSDFWLKMYLNSTTIQDNMYYYIPGQPNNKFFNEISK